MIRHVRVSRWFAMLARLVTVIYMLRKWRQPITKWVTFDKREGHATYVAMHEAAERVKGHVWYGWKYGFIWKVVDEVVRDGEPHYTIDNWNDNWMGPLNQTLPATFFEEVSRKDYMEAYRMYLKQGVKRV